MFSFVQSVIPNLYYVGIDTVPGPGKFHIWEQNSALTEPVGNFSVLRPDRQVFSVPLVDAKYWKFKIKFKVFFHNGLL